MRSHNKTMQSRCQNELGISAELRYVGFQKLLVIMRNRCQEGKTHACQETAKPMSRRKSKPNAKPMSRYCEADVNAMMEVLQSQGILGVKGCWSQCEDDVENGSAHAHKQMDAKWKHAAISVLYMFAVITSLPSVSLAQYSSTN